MREQLVDTFFQYGNVEPVEKNYKEAEESGIILQPNRMGFELFIGYMVWVKKAQKHFLTGKKFLRLIKK